MISIDGSGGEGGGQVLRTSIALSAVTKKPVTVFNIRAKRSNPGLRPQHLNAIKALAELCSAELKGSALDSMEIEFIPHEIKSMDLNLDIGTAGSITLVLQALMIPAVYAPGRVRVRITGGTDVRWSPSIDYLRFITLPVLQRFGYKAEIRLVRRGYYPAGGGRVDVALFPSEPKPINLMDRGEIISAGGISHAHPGLAKSDVATRQAKSALDDLMHLSRDMEVKQEYCKALSYGSGITLWVETKNSVLGADSLGERGKGSETVGREAARNLIKEIESNAALDRYMADQIVPYIALAGGSARVSEITKHTKTNVDIVNKFGFDVRIEGNTIKADKFNLSGF
ncbi:MAG: RNA 3'-terminal phosphate cyclase [Candidatus Altiarchaeota archaeon]|nr:RNA 3'-terminal phosphate cyclase [Candidatus Altiarchaeota archaeon]